MNHNGPGLAWNPDQSDRRRLLVIASVLCPLFLVMAVYISWITLPEQKREEKEALPPQLARLVLEKKEKPKPVVERKKEEPKPEPKPEPKVVEKPAQVKPKPIKPEPQVVKKPEPTAAEVTAAREKVKQTGILAMSNELSKLSALADSVQLDTPKTLTAQPIARKQTDALAAKASTGRSAGVDETKLSQQTQQLALADRAPTQVAPSAEVVAAVATELRQASADSAQRTKEEIRRIMDANKSAIYSIYSRELRKRPSLRGSITPELVIERNGVVSRCSVVESSLNEPSLEQRICSRLQMVNFGERAGVSQTTIRYPIELLPG